MKKERYGRIEVNDKLGHEKSILIECYEELRKAMKSKQRE